MHEYNINIYYWGRSRSSSPRAVYVCSYSLQRPVYNAKNNLTSKYFFFCKTTYHIFSYFFLGIFLIVVFCYKTLYLNLLNKIILPLMQFLIISISPPSSFNAISHIFNPTMFAWCLQRSIRHSEYPLRINGFMFSPTAHHSHPKHILQYPTYTLIFSTISALLPH